MPTTSPMSTRSWRWPRLRVEGLLHVGVLLLLLGLVTPWIELRSHWPHLRGPLDTFEWLLYRTTSSDPTDHVVQHWFLPLVYGLAAPALWCSRPRTNLSIRFYTGILWIAALLELTVVLSYLPLGPHPRPRELDVHVGYWITGLGAMLVGLPPVIQLARLRRRLARWRRRPGATQARRALDPGGLARLPYSLGRLVREARTLRADLRLQRPLDAHQTRMLADIVGQLHVLDPPSRAQLQDQGHDAHTLLHALAPTRPRPESGFEEMLRVDEALTRIEALGLRTHAATPYR